MEITEIYDNESIEVQASQAKFYFSQDEYFFLHCKVELWDDPNGKHRYYGCINSPKGKLLVGSGSISEQYPTKRRVRKAWGRRWEIIGDWEDVYGYSILGYRQEREILQRDLNRTLGTNLRDLQRWEKRLEQPPQTIINFMKHLSKQGS